MNCVWYIASVITCSIVKRWRAAGVVVERSLLRLSNCAISPSVGVEELDRRRLNKRADGSAEAKNLSVPYKNTRKHSID